MRKFIIKYSKYIIPLLVFSLWCLPVFAASGDAGAGYTGLSNLVLVAYYLSATFMMLMGAYQVARGFANEEFSKNKKDGLVFIGFGVVIFALAIGGGGIITTGMMIPADTPTVNGNTYPGIIAKLSGGFVAISQAVILWGMVHYIMAFTKDGLQDKHKGVALIAVGILLGYFAAFAIEILGSIGM